MELFNYVKAAVLNFRLHYCCWFAPVRIGLILTGYFNGLIAAICIIGTANDSLSTTLIQVQMKIMADYITKSVVMFAYITEVGFSVLCLCGIYRKDLILLRVYMYYCIAALVMSILVYSIVILAIDVVLQITILGSILFQLYVLLLVRSAIVEIKWENKKPELPTLVLSSVIQEEKEKETQNDSVSVKSQDSKPEEKSEENPETPVTPTVTDTNEVKTDVEKGPEETDKKNGNKKEVEIKLETVNEEAST